MKLKNVIRTNISADNRKEKLKGLSSGLFCYIILIGIGFVYLYPILYMVIISVMPTDDLINPTVNWIPSAIDFGSYASVYKALDYSNSLFIMFLQGMDFEVHRIKSSESLGTSSPICSKFILTES